MAVILGIAGTAKNTGKTTTTKAIMEEVQRDKNRVLGLTSIGYDGEDVDNITGLPKPKIEVWPGALVAVAERSLEVSTAQIELLEKTDIATPLGKVILGRVTKGGTLLIAGPNKSKELRRVLPLLQQYGANFIIVDGALNRIAPMVEVDSLIIATGAAKTPNITELAWETKHLVEILQFPVFNTPKNMVNMGSVLDIQAAQRLSAFLSNNQGVVIDGVISSQGLEYLIQVGEELKGKILILPDAIKLIVCGEVRHIYNLLSRLKELGLEIGVKKEVHVTALTVNPYYPQFRFSSNDYQEAYVDRKLLFQTIKNSVNIPVFDIVEEGGHKLYEVIVEKGI
ncbi:MAG: hypothetical protein JM58_08970 [Peptococcaceae bacterium BICA1-8]|nr:MAG: hypothetical protein JM58_08970 [Peptococcaceae bacterium BICA1-8]